jgi:flagellar hook protein FlgE
LLEEGEKMLTGSFYTALSGLQGSSTALNVVGNNLANINTTGFKRSRANFGQIMASTISGISGSGNPVQIGLGVKSTEIVSRFDQGSIQTTGIKTNLAIQGEGFFQVALNGTNGYTRSGNFGFDEQGFLIAANGGRVQGFLGTLPDGSLDNSSGIQDIQIDLGQAAPPKATELARFITNLSAEAADADSYATTIEVFDSKGVSHQVTLTMTKTMDNAGPPPTTDWAYQFAFNGDTANVTGGGAANTGSGTLVFDASGNLVTVDGNDIQAAGYTEPTISVSGLPGGANDLTFEWDAVDTPSDASQASRGFVTNYGNTNSTGTLFQDGYGSGVLQDIDFDQEGTMIGFFSNGLTLELARVAVATFNNRNGLKQTDGGFYLPTAASGPASIDGEGTGGRGSILASSLESSNVDIAEEFTDMIIHQRGYQSNSRTIVTIDQLLQEAINLKR